MTTETGESRVALGTRRMLLCLDLEAAELAVGQAYLRWWRALGAGMDRLTDRVEAYDDLRAAQQAADALQAKIDALTARLEPVT